MHRSLIAVALFLLAPMATAQVYTWTDASGTVHYSEAPPSKGTPYNKVTTTGTVAPRVAPAPTPPADNDKGAASTKPADSRPVADTPDNRNKLCGTLKTNLATLQGSGPVVMQQGDKANALDADQRKQQLDSTQSQYDQYCQAQ